MLKIVRRFIAVITAGTAAFYVSDLSVKSSSAVRSNISLRTSVIYTKYDLFSSDTEKAAKAYEFLSEQLCSELFNGHWVLGNWGVTAGYEQSSILLAALNYNYEGGIAPEVLAREEALGKLSKDDILRYSLCVDLPQLQYLYGNKVDFNKYILDESLANDIERVTDAYIDWEEEVEKRCEKTVDETGKEIWVYTRFSFEPLETLLVRYFEVYNYDCLETIDNYVYFDMMCQVDSKYESESEDDESNQLYQEKVIIPMFNSYEPYLPDYLKSVTQTTTTVTTTTTPSTLATTTTVTTKPSLPLTDLMTGDINGDGSVDGTDAGMVLREYAVLPEDRTFTEAQIKAGDINNDGSIDASDAGDILRYFAEKGAGYEGDDMAEWYKNLKF